METKQENKSIQQRNETKNQTHRRNPRRNRRKPSPFPSIPRNRRTSPAPQRRRQRNRSRCRIARRRCRSVPHLPDLSAASHYRYNSLSPAVRRCPAAAATGTCRAACVGAEIIARFSYSAEFALTELSLELCVEKEEKRGPKQQYYYLVEIIATTILCSTN